MTVPALIGRIGATEFMGATEEVALISAERGNITPIDRRAAEVLCVAVVSVLAAREFRVLNRAIIAPNQGVGWERHDGREGEADEGEEGGLHLEIPLRREERKVILLEFLMKLCWFISSICRIYPLYLYSSVEPRSDRRRVQCNLMRRADPTNCIKLFQVRLAREGKMQHL